MITIEYILYIILLSLKYILNNLFSMISNNTTKIVRREYVSILPNLKMIKSDSIQVKVRMYW